MDATPGIAGQSMWWRRSTPPSSRADRAAIDERMKTPHLRGSCDGGTQIRTGDTTIFSRVLYQLSYPAGASAATRRAWER